MTRRERRLAERAATPEAMGADELAAPPATPVPAAPEPPAGSSSGWSLGGPPEDSPAGERPADDVGPGPFAPGAPPQLNEPEPPARSAEPMSGLAALGLDPDLEPLSQEPASGEHAESVAAERVPAESVPAEPVPAEQPFAEQPFAELPDAEMPVTEQPLAEQADAEQPDAEQPLTEQPLAEQPFAEQPLTEQPDAESSSDGAGGEPESDGATRPRRGARRPADSSARRLSEPSVAATAHLIDPGELARPRPSEWVALVLAVLLPPVGVVAGIVTAIRSSRRRGWAIPLTKIAIAVGVLCSVLAGFFAVSAYAAYQSAQRHDAVARSSIAFCAAVHEDPETLASPTYGWPEPRNTIPESIEAMQAYADRWTAIASAAPAPLRPGIQGIVDTAAGIIETTESSRRIAGEQHFVQLRGAIESSGVDEWVATYCE